jgi:uncharacterized protein YjiS (DUF1127 family)
MIMSTHNIRIECIAYDPLTRLISASIAAVTAGKRLIWSGIVETIRYRALRAAEAELLALDDRTLVDIGLERSEIKSVLQIAREETLRRRPLDPLPDVTGR